MDNLAELLKGIQKNPASLEAAVELLEKRAPPVRQNHSNDEVDYKQLVSQYKKSQCAMKSGPSKKISQISNNYFALNFAKFRRQLKGFKKTTPNIQVVGFTDEDSHLDVITKAAKALDVHCNLSQLSLICSNGLVPGHPIEEKQWTLGKYIELHGGTQNRSKKVWGLNIPYDDDDDDDSQPGSCNQKRQLACSTPTANLKRARLTSPALSSSASLVINYASGGNLELQDAIVKYCPAISGKIDTSVTAIGQVGVWRCTQLDFTSSNEAVLEDMACEDQIFQPELHDFFVVELSKGSTTYLKAKPMDKGIPGGEITYVTGQRAVHSEQEQCVDFLTKKFASLFVISPNHGHVHYQWERKGGGEWENICLPSNTCVLYVKSSGIYKCTVDEQSYQFEVKDVEKETKGSSNVDDGSRISIEDLTFGKIIGSGSFGKVYKGKWKDIPVALKCIPLSPGSDVSLLPTSNEVDILRNLDHPNIISLLAYSMTSEKIVLVTNLVIGKNLDTVIFNKKYTNELTSRRAIDIALKISDAINYMHSHNPIVIHQDLKPQNVLVDIDFKQVYVCDMGIARVKQITDATVTCVSKGPGTFPYMAPEMFKASRRGTAVDMYSLGCLYIELFGRKRVWGTLDGPSIMLKILGSYDVPPQGPSVCHLPEESRELCSRLCHLDSTKRIKSQETVEIVRKWLLHSSEQNA